MVTSVEVVVYIQCQECVQETGYRCHNLLVIIFYPALVTSFDWASG